jgi:hypothetical protein
MRLSATSPDRPFDGDRGLPRHGHLTTGTVEVYRTSTPLGEWCISCSAHEGSLDASEPSDGATPLGTSARFELREPADDCWLARGIGMNRTHHVHFRASAKEWAILQELAAADELSVSAVLRSLIRRANDGKTDRTAATRASLERRTLAPLINNTTSRR